MKRLGVVFILCLLSVYCFGQSQMGEASYNPSKSGLTISHSSMSFGTRVRVINLTNNSEVIAMVDGRIPASDPRVADISREAGDAIGMARTGYTRVRIEQIVPQQPAAVAPVPAPIPEPPASTSPAQEPRQTPAPAPSSQQEIREEIIQVVTPSQVQYIPAPVVEQVNCPLFPVVILLLALVAALLAAILVLLICARRFPWWPGYPWWFWRYPPLVVRRRIRRLKNRRI